MFPLKSYIYILHLYLMYQQSWSSLSPDCPTVMFRRSGSQQKDNRSIISTPYCVPQIYIYTYTQPEVVHYHVKSYCNRMLSRHTHTIEATAFFDAICKWARDTPSVIHRTRLVAQRMNGGLSHVWSTRTGPKPRWSHRSYISYRQSHLFIYVEWGL